VRVAEGSPLVRSSLAFLREQALAVRTRALRNATIDATGPRDFAAVTTSSIPRTGAQVARWKARAALPYAASSEGWPPRTP
jgi:hypothetical protein